ncbi:hypothetical protein EE612_034349, partial [Oryza sativa]
FTSVTLLFFLQKLSNILQLLLLFFNKKKKSNSSEHPTLIAQCSQT